jgi:hypothetical protein
MFHVFVAGSLTYLVVAQEVRVVKVLGLGFLHGHRYRVSRGVERGGVSSICLLLAPRLHTAPVGCTDHPFSSLQSFGRRIPFAFLEDVKGRVAATYGASALQVCVCRGSAGRKIHVGYFGGPCGGPLVAFDTGWRGLHSPKTRPV